MQAFVLMLAMTAPLHPACGDRPGARRVDRLACSVVASVAQLRGMDPALVAELAWSETRWRPARVSVTGCVGLLQHQPRYWRSGLDALAYYLGKHDHPVLAVCDYKTRGTPRCSPADRRCCPSSQRVVRRAGRLRDALTVARTRRAVLRSLHGDDDHRL